LRGGTLSFFVHPRARFAYGRRSLGNKYLVKITLIGFFCCFAFIGDYKLLPFCKSYIFIVYFWHKICKFRKKVLILRKFLKL